MYTFTHADTDVVTEHANLKAFKEWAVANLALLEGVPFVHGTSVNDGTREFGTLKYIAPSQRAPKMVTPDTESTTTLADVLADIDALELDDVRNDTNDEDASDLHDTHEPVHLTGTPAEDIDAIVDWQMGRSGGQLPAVITVRPPAEPVRRRAAGRVTAPRMSHKDCGHAITGEAGKLARAACRAERRANAAAA